MKLYKHKIILLLGTFYLTASVLAQSDPYAVRYKDVVYSPFGTELSSPNSNKPLPEEVKKITIKESTAEKNTASEGKKLINKELSAQKSTTDLKFSSFEDAKKKCAELGFRSGTDRFGNCVLTLTK
jgi:hypothetical protein